MADNNRQITSFTFNGTNHSTKQTTLVSNFDIFMIKCVRAKNYLTYFTNTGNQIDIHTYNQGAFQSLTSISPAKNLQMGYDFSEDG